MSIKQEIIAHTHTDELSKRCPVDHKTYSQQKTSQIPEAAGAPISCDNAGIWHVQRFDDARTILRSPHTKQAGFNAELMHKLPQTMRPSILFLEGKTHHQQRKQTARFFAPKVVSTKYRALMKNVAKRHIAILQRQKRIELSNLTLEMAASVIAEVVGLTNSLLPGMPHRLETFLHDAGTATNKSRPHAFLHFLRGQILTAIFFLVDVKPAIKARKCALQEDVISHLIGQNAKDSEILMECITYAAAGMATTREFISISTWHFLEQPELRMRYLSAPEAERYEMLHEILRMEPVVSHLYRRTTADLSLEHDGQPITIPEGALIDLHIYGTNADEAVVGEHALEICPGRKIHGDAIPSVLMSFGDGQHRCPGSFIAIQETDIMLQHLLALDGLFMEQPPTLLWNTLLTSYEVRNFSLKLR
jgi:cytochrome P450